MPAGHRPARRPLTRADLPDELTPDTVRGLDVGTIRRLSQPGNGVLGADEQRTFDQALRVVMQDATDRLDQSLRRARRGGPGGLDASLRRSYDRTEQRLESQARRARQAFPQLTRDWPTPAAPEEPVATEAVDEEISLGTLESEIEQTSDMMELLERIATIEQQQLEHHRNQSLRDVRGFFFAFVVSVAVIVAGVAPLVEADADQRRLIGIWTVAVCAAAAVMYAVVRAVQNRGDADDG